MSCSFIPPKICNQDLHIRAVIPRMRSLSPSLFNPVAISDLMNFSATNVTQRSYITAMDPARQPRASVQAGAHEHSCQPTATSLYPASGLSLSSGPCDGSAHLSKNTSPTTLKVMVTLFESRQVSELLTQENQPLCHFLGFLQQSPEMVQHWK